MLDNNIISKINLKKFAIQTDLRYIKIIIENFIHVVKINFEIMLWLILIIIGIIILIGVIVLVSYLIKFYNSQIVIKNKVDEAWSDIDVQLKRRYDLIPNLVETVKGYASHESSTLENVIKARNMAMQATDTKDKAKAENFLSDTLKSLFAVSEQYPQLKANKNFINLQNKLSEIEEIIQKSRRYYNGNVRDFNTKIQKFPNNIFAPIMGFKPREFFKIKTQKERENVKVEF